MMLVASIRAGVTGMKVLWRCHGDVGVSVPPIDIPPQMRDCDERICMREVKQKRSNKGIFLLFIFLDGLRHFGEAELLNEELEFRLG